MSLSWVTPPPPPEPSKGLSGWLHAQWRHSKELWSHILEPGCGLYYDGNDDLAVKVDNSTITCSASGIAATGAVLKSGFQASGDVLVGTGVSAYTRLPVGTTDAQVLSVDSAASQFVAWKDPQIRFTLCFAAVDACAIGAYTIGFVERTGSLALIAVPPGKRLNVCALWGSARTGAGAGTYHVEFGLYDKTGSTEYALVTVSGTAGTTLHAYEEWALDSSPTGILGNSEVYLMIKNRGDSVAALAAGPHQVFVVGYFT